MLETYSEEYSKIKQKIDDVIKYGEAITEVAKGDILSSMPSYINFISMLTQANEDKINEVIQECSNWLVSDQDIQDNFKVLSDHSSQGIATGEVRVHSYTFYLMVRLLQPEIIIETGVANGKTSVLMLEALARNKHGQLISIDIETTSDFGDDKHKANGMEIGWLVPERLRDRWDLRIGRSDEVLPQLEKLVNCVDIFIHDSLSTYENMMYEYGQAQKLLKRNGLLISDDIETCTAFEEFVDSNCHSINCYGTLGSARIVI